MDLKYEDVELRVLKEKDLELLMAWRSHPELYKWFYEQEGPLNWEEHYTWFKNRKNRKDWIIVLDGKFRRRDVGSLNISELESKFPEVGVLIGEITAWGEGIAKKALKIGVEYLRENGYDGAKANILKNNKRSINLFKASGFTKIGINRKNEKKFELEFE